MLQNLPTYITVVFILTTLIAVGIFHVAVSRSSNYRKYASFITLGLLVWMGIQAALALNNTFNSDFPIEPPRFAGLPLPLFLVIIVLFVTKWGRRFIDDLPLLPLTWLHTVRVPVEMVLYWLFLNQAVPELMTFAGRNFDILAGLTAPVIAYRGSQQGLIGRKGLLAWNIICLALVMSIVIHAILSLPSTIQQLAFDQPNIGVLNFPFVWLPGVVVPLVFFSHFVAIRRLLQNDG